MDVRSARCRPLWGGCNPSLARLIRMGRCGDCGGGGDVDNVRGAGRNTTGERNGKAVYWHRELPPLEAEPLGEHTLEASSDRVHGAFFHGDERWDLCHRELMDYTRSRLEQEILRLGGRYAQVLSESIDSRHDDASGDAWLHGKFTYMLYR
jgi:hypothetical protein